MITYILNKLGYYNYDELNYIRHNLKHTKTLKKQFYIPNKKELLNKMITIRYKNKLLFNNNDLINSKKNLKSI